MTDVAYNLREALERAKSDKEENQITIEKLHRDTGVSKTTIYDIMEDRVKPRKTTLEALESGLHLKKGSLSRKRDYFDKEYFLKQVQKKYLEKPCIMECPDDCNNHDCDGFCYYSIEEFLIIELGMSTDSYFRGKMPDDKIQEKVSQYFGIPKKDLFIPISKYSSEDFLSLNLQGIPSIKKVNVVSKAVIDENDAMALFKMLDRSYQKTIYNIMCDFYMLSHKFD